MVVRRMDNWGRVMIPKEIRKNAGVREGEPLEIFTENNMIRIKKYELEKKEREKIREYVAQNYQRILSLFSDGDKGSSWRNEKIKKSDHAYLGGGGVDGML